MGLPLVSIVTPSFNCGKYIRQTIESVLTQSYTNLEHIIIDGESTDNTITILKEYKELIWISEKDQGQSNAINKGFRKATGEIIGWLNSDDTYQPCAIEYAVEFFLNNPNVDIVFTDINIINEKNEIVGISRGGDFDLERILTFNMVKQPSTFMRRKVIDSLSGLNEELHFVMDQEFWLRAGLNNFNFRYLKHLIFANFRLVPGTKSYESALSFSKEWYEILKIYLKHPRFNSISLFSRNKILNHSHANIYVATMVRATESGNKYLVLRSFYKSIKINPTLIRNLGMWKLLIFGLLGMQNDKLLKFNED